MLGGDAAAVSGSAIHLVCFHFIDAARCQHDTPLLTLKDSGGAGRRHEVSDSFAERLVPIGFKCHAGDGQQRTARRHRRDGRRAHASWQGGTPEEIITTVRCTTVVVILQARDSVQKQTVLVRKDVGVHVNLQVQHLAPIGCLVRAEAYILVVADLPVDPDNVAARAALVVDSGRQGRLARIATRAGRARQGGIVFVRLILLTLNLAPLVNGTRLGQYAPLGALPRVVVALTFVSWPFIQRRLP
mmetsp:Transcript_10978/g.26842  ORF Transcript_10978/g.26842 Transcript_10978/m.26842 type:complete len:244 (-) Transcript_10978:1045-1776(-)